MNELVKPLVWKITYKLKNLSGLRIGSGRAENSDSDLLVDSAGEPFIPGTTIAGILRSRFNDPCNQLFASEDINKIFGFSNNSSSAQSSLTVFDAFCSASSQIIRRDGVAIDNRLGVAKDKAKFDYEVLKPGTEFTGELRLQLASTERSLGNKVVDYIVSLLKSGNLQFGGAQSAGFGLVECLACEAWFYNLKERVDLRSWLEAKPGNRVDTNSTEHQISNDLRIRITCKLRDSLLIRDYEGELFDPDAVAIHWQNGDYYIPGSSLRGAVRAQAQRVHALFESDPKILDSMFGLVASGNNNMHGKLTVHDSPLNDVTAAIHNRVKIDRFTGGSIKGALFDTKAVFPVADSNSNTTFNFVLKSPSSEECGLLLLVAKDVANGNVAIGGEKGIGRGRFELVEAQIQWGADNMTWKSSSANEIQIESSNLKKFNDAITDFTGGF